MEDLVNHPSHYNQGKVECIDGIESALTGLEGFEAYLTGNILKYIWRWKSKNGVEDLKKARWYLNKLIEKAEGNDGSCIIFDGSKVHVRPLAETSHRAEEW